MKRLLALSISLALIGGMSVNGASAAKTKPRAPVLSKREKAFIASCTQAFEFSTPDKSSGGVGRSICECTAKESRTEGVSPEAMERETAHIKADPKHRIEDQKLLDAFHNCSIQVLQSG